MWQFESEVSEVIQRAPDVKSLRFPVNGSGIRYLPGQFSFLTMKLNGHETVRHFSFSSSPTEKGYIEFTKRVADNEYSQALNAVKPGMKARLYGPDGFFTLPLRQRRLAFLSAGIGITPLRSMLRYITDKGLDYDIVFLHNTKTCDGFPFHEEIDAMAASNPLWRVEYILPGPDAPEVWNGKTGNITSSLVEELVPDYKERLFYLSGPAGMVLDMDAQLKKLEIMPHQIKRDVFSDKT